MLRFEEKERQAERFAVSQVILSSEECKQTSGPQRLKPQFLRSYRHDWSRALPKLYDHEGAPSAEALG